MWDWLLARIWKTLACAASFPRTSKELCKYVVSKTWVCKVIISQGAGHSNSKRHREPRNYQQQPPVMPNRWGKWFRTTGFWSSRALVVDPAPSTCKVWIIQGVGHSNSKRHRLITNDLTKRHTDVSFCEVFLWSTNTSKRTTQQRRNKKIKFQVQNISRLLLLLHVPTAIPWLGYMKKKKKTGEILDAANAHDLAPKRCLQRKLSPFNDSEKRKF